MSAEQRRWLAGLYEANFAAVFRRCGVLLKSAEDAADAAHEVFLIAVNSLAPKTEEKRARAWLLTVAHNHCLDILRRRKRFGRALENIQAVIVGDRQQPGARSITAWIFSDDASGLAGRWWSSVRTKPATISR